MMFEWFMRQVIDKQSIIKIYPFAHLINNSDYDLGALKGDVSLEYKKEGIWKTRN